MIEVRRPLGIVDQSSEVEKTLTLSAYTIESKAKELLDTIHGLLSDLCQDPHFHRDHEYCVETALRKCNEILPSFPIFGHMGMVFKDKRHQFGKMLRDIYQERQESYSVYQLDSAGCSAGFSSKLMATNYTAAAAKISDILAASDGPYSNPLPEAFRYSTSPLQLAMLDGNDESTARLLTLPDATIRENYLKRSAFHILAEHEKPGLIRSLLSRAPETMTAGFQDGRDIFHRTPLHIAAARGDVETFRLLLEHGSRIENRDKDANNCLTLAAANGHEEIVALALEHGLDPNDHLLRVMTPLYAAARGGHFGVCKLLLDENLGERQAIPTVDVRGKQPAEIALENGFKELSYFIQGMVDKFTPSRDYTQPLFSWPLEHMSFNEPPFFDMLNTAGIGLDMSDSFG